MYSLRAAGECVYSNDLNDETTVADRATFTHLLEFRNGLPTLGSERSAEFMASVSGLPSSWCRAWDEVDSLDAHSDAAACPARAARSA